MPSRFAALLLALLLLPGCGLSFVPTGSDEQVEEEEMTLFPEGSEIPKITGDEDEDYERLDAMAAAIDTMAHAGPADSPLVCEALPMGSKPCGGPRRYIVVSEEATDIDELSRRLSIYNRYEENYNREYELTSDCAIVSEPAFVVNDNQCMAAE